MFISHLTGVLGDFKDLISNEIEEVLQVSEPQKDKEQYEEGKII